MNVKRNLFFLAMLTDLQQHYIKKWSCFQHCSVFSALFTSMLPAKAPQLLRSVNSTWFSGPLLAQFANVYWTYTSFIALYPSPGVITLKACMWVGEWWFIHWTHIRNVWNHHHHFCLFWVISCPLVNCNEICLCFVFILMQLRKGLF